MATAPPQSPIAHPDWTTQTGGAPVFLLTCRRELVPVSLDRLVVRLRGELTAEKQLGFRLHVREHRGRWPVFPGEQAVFRG